MADAQDLLEQLRRAGGLPPQAAAQVGIMGRDPVVRTHLKAEIDKWGPIIKKAGVFAD